MKEKPLTGGDTSGRPEAWIGRGEVRTFLDPGTSVTGKLSFSAPTRIEGQLKGEVHASGLLMVGAGARVEAQVEAQTLIIEGRVKGEVKGAERVEIKPGGELIGSVETRVLVVEEGGHLEGDCRMPQAKGEKQVPSEALPHPRP